jgi:metal-responsive CopG/Arc/MetJ family transcriptional regulator
MYQKEVLRMATDKARYTVSVDDDLFQRIEDFRYQNRYATRSEATAELIRIGLDVLRKSGSIDDVKLEDLRIKSDAEIEDRLKKIAEDA